MWLWRWWRWICSEVRFRAEGGLCETFLNALMSEGVMLWDVNIEEGAVTASCYASAYRRVRIPARRTGTRVRAVCYRGAAKRLRAYRKRIGLLVGAMLAVAVYIVLASHIWVVDIAVGDDRLRRAVADELATYGVAVGKPIKKADLEAASMNTIAAVDGIHAVSVWFEGCIAHVDVRLEEPSTTIADTAPANVTAARDGRILEMRVTAGQRIAKVGEGVVKGDLLVCGAVETTAGILFQHASAVVMAETERVYEGAASRREIVSIPQERCEQRTWYCLWWRLPLYSSATFADDRHVTTQTYPLMMFDTALPIGIHTRVYTRYVDRAVTYTEEEVRALAKERALAAANDLEGVTVTDVVETGYWDGDTYHVRLTYACVENIACEVPLLVNTE